MAGYSSKTRRASTPRARTARAAPRRAATSRNSSRGTVSRRGAQVVRVVLEAPAARPTMNAQGRMVEAVIPGKAKF